MSIQNSTIFRLSQVQQTTTQRLPRLPRLSCRQQPRANSSKHIMAAGSQSLYGIPRAKKQPHHEIEASSSLVFSSQLSALLSQSRPITARRPKGRQDDIFSTHNRGSKKRAAADTLDGGQRHQKDIGAVDSTILQRSKRQMEEKARIYAAMKRGDYVPSKKLKSGLAGEAEPLVNFDRKWAEADEASAKPNDETSSGSDDGQSEDEELVEYEDELGRHRKGTRAEALREQRHRRGLINAERNLTEMSARPAMPNNIIYGDAVQAAAFNPEEPIAAKMEELAQKRDRSATPPPETHYDATKEVRSKGVGFYQFSGDKEGRARELENLQLEREETMKRQKERTERKDARKQEIEERRQLIREKRGEKLANRFLDSLG